MLDEALDRGDKREAPGAVIDALARRIRGGLLAGAGGLEQAFRFLEMWARRLREDTSDRVAPQTLRMLEAVAGQVRKQMGDLVTVDPEIRARMEVIDLVMTIAVGLYRDRVLFSEKGLDAVNHLDYKDWLRKHGATGRVLESQFLNGIYDLAFAFRNGDRTQPSLAAGVALRGALRMFFTYRGAMFWRLRSGMGDAVFAPLFRVLQDLRFTDPALQAEKKVTFRFLHELTDLTVRDAAGVPLVERMAFAASKATKWKKEDEPLDAAGCWSYRKPAVTAKPVRSLARGKDFDAVILAIPIESLRAVMASKKATWITAAKSKAVSPKAAAKAPGAKAAPRPLGDAMPLEWQKALRYLTTAATQSVQVWMREDLE
jgi:hypothetical protein